MSQLQVIFLLAALGLCGANCPTKAWYLFGNKCYIFKNEFATFEQNIRLCKNLNATMVSIQSSEENEFLKGKLPPNNSYWIGLRQIALGVPAFSWMDNAAMNFTQWSEGHPSTLTVAKWAATIYNGQWYDKDATNSFYQLCQISLGQPNGVNAIDGSTRVIDEIILRSLANEESTKQLESSIVNLSEAQKQTHGKLDDLSMELKKHIQEAMTSLENKLLAYNQEMNQKLTSVQEAVNRVSAAQSTPAPPAPSPAPA